MDAESMSAQLSFKNGDVRIKATYQNHLIFGQVSSHSMARISKPMENFFFNPLARTSLEQSDPLTTDGSDNGVSTLSRLEQYRLEINRAPVEEVDFTEDDCDTLLILLRIAHLQFGEVPKEIPFRMLVHVATFCDQYDCVRLVKPWLEGWIDELKHTLKMPGFESWLWISWVFGKEDMFKQLSRYMIFTVGMAEDSQCLTLEGEVIAEPMPSDIIRRILQSRIHNINQLLNIPYNVIRRYDNKTKELVCSSRDAFEAEECDAVVYGSLVRGLQRLDLWPMKDPYDIPYNVNTLTNKMRDLHLIKPNSSPNSDAIHGLCGFAGPILHYIYAIMRANQSPVVESDLRHMERQRRELEGSN